MLLPTFLEDVSTCHRLVHGVGISLALAGLLVHAITDASWSSRPTPTTPCFVLAVVDAPMRGKTAS